MTEPDELFPPESVAMLSPKLKWLARHGLTLTRQPNGRWVCGLDDDNWGAGANEDEAIADFCETTGIKHYLT